MSLVTGLDPEALLEYAMQGEITSEMFEYVLGQGVVVPIRALCSRDDLPRTLQEHLATHAESLVRYGAAQRLDLLPHLSHLLVSDPKTAVRSELAAHTLLWDVQEALATQGVLDVLWSLAGNTSLAPHLGVELSFSSRHIVNALALNPTVEPTVEYSALYGRLHPDSRRVLARLLPGVDVEASWALAETWRGTIRSLGEAIELVGR